MLGDLDLKKHEFFQDSSCFPDAWFISLDNYNEYYILTVIVDKQLKNYSYHFANRNEKQRKSQVISQIATDNVNENFDRFN
ncbi:hypothetical protein KSF78_0006260 [Schistosoma japonicum]|nr:hypothetical protein KSF78_0006260 [Schistosoma japonicum]